MAILSLREVLPRTMTHRFGETPTAQMKFLLTLDGPTSHQAMFDAVNYKFGASHPEFGYLYSTSGSISETDYYHAEVTIDFSVPPQELLDEQGQPDPSPLSRPDVWEYSTSSASTPAIVHFPIGGDNSTRRPITNTAGDPIFGVTTQIGELKVSISGNRAVFPAGDAVAVSGAINADAYLGAQPYTWQCTGITGRPEVENVNGVNIRFWKVTAELCYRQQGYLVSANNVGLNVWENQQDSSGQTKPKKIRAYTTVVEGGIAQKIPTSEPVALNPDGSMRVPEKGSDDQGTPPDVLMFRVHPAVSFAAYFGSPPQ